MVGYKNEILKISDMPRLSLTTLANYIPSRLTGWQLCFGAKKKLAFPLTTDESLVEDAKNIRAPIVAI